MTVDDVLRRIETIRGMSHDDEAAHSAEDDLWDHVLIAIAVGVPNPQELAAAALRTKDIKFARWCA